MKLGHKIIVLGCSGSGKSTFSKKLHDITGLPLLHLDNIWWMPDRSHISREEFDRKLGEILQMEKWIIDGDYSRTYEARFMACDTVIFLDYSFDECLNGIIERVGKEREDIPWIEQELDPELVKLVENYKKDNLPVIAALMEKYSDKSRFVFRTRLEADEWMNGLIDGGMDKNNVSLLPMTSEMYHRYFMEYENDPDLYLDMSKYVSYTYSKEKVDQYIQRQADLKRIPLAILVGDDIAGEIIIKNIENNKCATMGLSLKNARYKDRGIGTQAERLAIQYVFRELDIPTLYADSIWTNTRSQHVLEKVGFTLTHDDRNFKYYRIDRDMDIELKKMETDDEIRGKAYVHWKAWHEAYPGMVSEEYLDKLTLEKCEKMVYSWPDNLIVAKDNGRVIGFIGCGDRGEEAPDIGEIFALYVLSEYYGKGVAQRLMKAGLKKLERYPQICLWVLKDNKRAIRFYEKCGFSPDGKEMTSPNIGAVEIRMISKAER